MADAFGKLPGAHFYRLMAQMRRSHPDESRLMFLAFDLLHQHGVDLRGAFPYLRANANFTGCAPGRACPS